MVSDQQKFRLVVLYWPAAAGVIYIQARREAELKEGGPINRVQGAWVLIDSRDVTGQANFEGRMTAKGDALTSALLLITHAVAAGWDLSIPC